MAIFRKYSIFLSWRLNAEAVRNLDVDELKRLLSDGAEVDALDDNEMTALMHACKLNAAPCVEVLLEVGADFTLKSKGLCILLLKDPANGPIVAELERDPSALLPKIPYSASCLNVTCAYGHEECVKLLLGKMKKKNKMDIAKSTNCAKCNGHDAVVQLLPKVSITRRKLKKKK